MSLIAKCLSRMNIQQSLLEAQTDEGGNISPCNSSLQNNSLARLWTSIRCRSVIVYYNIDFSSFTARSKSSDRVNTIVAASFNRAKFGATDVLGTPSRLSLNPKSQSALTPKVLDICATVWAAGSFTPRSQELYDVCFTPILAANSLCEEFPLNSLSLSAKIAAIKISTPFGLTYLRLLCYNIHR